MNTTKGLQQKIEQAGGRATPARTRVLAALEALASPASHGDVERQVHASSRRGVKPIHRVTLYRILDWLCQLKLAHRMLDVEGIWRFRTQEVVAAHREHLHFRCGGCAQIFCLSVPFPRRPELPEGFVLSSMHIDLQGRCRKCSQG
jgi:Fur family ferric uptake transcriptional regulator